MNAFVSNLVKDGANFQLDERLSGSSFLVGSWPLSEILFKDNAYYPWLILVPRVDTTVIDLDELPKELQHQLMDEISELSRIVKVIFKPNKVNVATLGNIVKQLHIHVVARFEDDRLWPQGIWQEAQTTRPYEEEEVGQLIGLIKKKCRHCFASGSQ